MSTTFLAIGAIMLVTIFVQIMTLWEMKKLFKLFTSLKKIDDMVEQGRELGEIRIDCFNKQDDDV